MAAGMMMPMGGRMMTAVHAETSPVWAGVTEIAMLGYSDVLSPEQVERYLKFLENGSMGLLLREKALICRPESCTAHSIEKE